MSIESRLDEFRKIATSPKQQLLNYKSQGRKAIGIIPYYVPEELVYAAGMVPFGIWGSNNKTIARAKEYCATFYCSIAQLAIEMLLDGTMDELDGIITPTICDTLRPMSQNFRFAMRDKMSVIFLAQPQNRFNENGLKFSISQFTHVKEELEKVAGTTITNDALKDAIKIYNKSRAARRRFVELANDHCDVISPTNRAYVLKAGWFILKDAYTEMLEGLNAELEALPVCNWDGVKVVTSGIICDNPSLLAIFEENHIAIAADDVAHESRSFNTDVPEDDDPMMALALQLAHIDYDVLLYDPASDQNRRGEHVVDLVKKSGAQGLVVFMQQFCDPEEMEYPYLKRACEAAGVPQIKLGIDQQMRDFGQASTALQAFADMIGA